MDEESVAARSPVYLTPVRDLYSVDLPGGGRVDARRHGGVLTALIWVPLAGDEPIEFDLRRWHYRQWAAQIEDREYSEGLRALITEHALFEHPEWITGDRPTDLDADRATVLDDLRATWRSRFGGDGTPPTVGAQLCSLCIAAEPPRGPLTVWSPAASQRPCPHRDAAATALLALVAQHDELVLELVDLMVVAQMPGAPGGSVLRRFVLPSDWMRALLGHWLLGQHYVHREHPWRARGAARHRRFSHRVLRLDGSVELTAEERYSALAWGINAEDLALLPEEAESAAPEGSWWTDAAGLPPPGVRVLPEGDAAKPLPSSSTPRAKAPARASAPLFARSSPQVTSAPDAPRPPLKKAAPTKPTKPTKPAAKRVIPPPAEAKNEGLEQTLSSLTAGLAALSQIMGGPKPGRR